MSSAYYELYLKLVLDLAKTLVIKSQDSALSINEYLTLLGYAVDNEDPTTWKYYKNLAGEYHEADKAQLLAATGSEYMRVTSLDDPRMTIDFTKANLDIHRATRREYTIRSRYYRELAARYPDREQLILGIVNPVDIQTAIAADDHTILYYDNELVESNEVNLIPKLQEFITAFFHRWDVPDYHFTDALFSATQFGILSAMLPKEILNIRLANCRTDYAHSYHIRQYLTSFGKLDAYFDYMTNKQRLFFYRNIRHININNGKTETFDWLTQKVLTDRNFPLARYTIQQNNADQFNNLKPEVEVERTSINGLDAALGKDVKTVMELLELENRVARANPEHMEEEEDHANAVMRNALSGKLPTKVLESNVLDLSDAEPFTLAEVLLNHWIYFSNIGLYRTVLTLNNPNNNEPILLPAREAWLLYLYAYNKAHGLELKNIPVFDAKRVVRIPPPDRNELLAMVQRGRVPEIVVDHAIELNVKVDTYISVEAFREACVEIHAAMMKRRDLAVLQQHYLTRGEVEQMVDRFYMDFKIDVNSGYPYDQWLDDHGYNFDGMDRYGFELLATDIFEQITGHNISTRKTLRDIHAAMVKLMAHLSSYNVQYIQEINSGVLKIIDWSHLRYGDQEWWSGHDDRYLHSVAMPQTADSKQKYASAKRLDVYVEETDQKTYHQVANDITLYNEPVLKTYNHNQGLDLVMFFTEIPDPVINLSTILPGEAAAEYITPADRQLSELFTGLESTDFVIGTAGLTLTPTKALQELIQTKLTGGLLVEYLSLGQPTFVSGTLTKVKIVLNKSLAPVEFWDVEGEVIFQYHRIDLGTVLNPLDRTFAVDFPTTTRRVLREVTNRHGIVFEYGDCNDEIIEGPGTYTVEAKPHSKRWLGTTTVTLTAV